MTQWSVGIRTEGDREVELAEVVELGDAVAPHGGIATGAGQQGYGAQVLVVAGTRDEAIAEGRRVFAEAVATAGLPTFAIVHVEATSEAEDAEEPW